MAIKAEVKLDNAFVYNIVAKCIVPFTSLIIFNYRYTLFFKRY